MTTAKNTAADKEYIPFRPDWLITQDEDGHHVEAYRAPDLGLDDTGPVDMRDITRAIRTLPPHLIPVAKLHYIEDIPVREIADQLEMPRRTVRNYIDKAAPRIAPVVERHWRSR